MNPRTFALLLLAALAVWGAVVWEILRAVG